MAKREWFQMGVEVSRETPSNSRRVLPANPPSRENRRRRVCKAGLHLMVGDNVLIERVTGRPDAPRCRECYRAAQRERMRRVRAAAKAAG